MKTTYRQYRHRIDSNIPNMCQPLRTVNNYTELDHNCDKCSKIPIQWIMSRFVDGDKRYIAVWENEFRTWLDCHNVDLWDIFQPKIVIFRMQNFTDAFNRYTIFFRYEEFEKMLATISDYGVNAHYCFLQPSLCTGCETYAQWVHCQNNL